MSDSIPYPGSPSLAADAREKVTQTFQHTLELARAGRNEEALLGCDFILKMDGRYVPAKRLLETLRGVASGTVVDLSEFAGVGRPAARPASVAPAPNLAASPTLIPTAKQGMKPVQMPAAPAPPGPPGAAPDPFGFSAPAPGAGGGGLGGFDDFALSDPFASSATPPAPAAAAAPGAPGGGSSLDDLGFGQPPDFPSFASPASPAFPSAPSAPAFGGPSPFEAPPAAPASAPAAPAAPAPSYAAPSTAVDPRIAQFLRQGDDAMARGQLQEAIDLWSRVFLIDLSNEEASRRIDSAREKQAQTAQQIDVLISEGIQAYDAGDLQGARGRFLDVLALSESDSTARSYLNQIDAALSAKETTSAGIGASPFGAAPAFEGDLGASGGAYEGEAYGAEASDALGEAPVAPTPEPSAKKTIRLDGRLLGGLAAVLLLGGGAAAYFLVFAKKEPPRPVDVGTKGGGGTAPRPIGEDLIAKAGALIEQQKLDDAMQILVGIPDSDPRHAEALALIEKIKSAGPATGAPTFPAAELDAMRATGLAALRESRYIDAVRALDPVAKARPDDAEVVEALAKAREQADVLRTALKAFNEQDFEAAVKLLWDVRRKDMKNRDAEEYLFKAYYNDGVQSLQAGNFKKAAESFKEAVALHAADDEAQRHLKFARKYPNGTTDLLSKVYVKYLVSRS